MGCLTQSPLFTPTPSYGYEDYLSYVEGSMGGYVVLLMVLSKTVKVFSLHREQALALNNCAEKFYRKIFVHGFWLLEISRQSYSTSPLNVSCIYLVVGSSEAYSQRASLCGVDGIYSISHRSKIGRALFEKYAGNTTN